jgi:hypothetical protein
MTDAVKELSLKLSGVCAGARKELNWEQVYEAVTFTLADTLRSCDCGDCRREALRHADRFLLKELRNAAIEGADRYPRRVGQC